MTTSRTPSRRITQRRIAELAGVSQATVSLVLNDKADGAARIPEETRERVLKVLRETGYVADPAARRLAGVGNKILGVFTYEPHYHREPGLLRAAAEWHRAGRRGARLRPALLTSTPVVNGSRQVLPRARPTAPRRRMPSCWVSRSTTPSSSTSSTTDTQFVAVGRRDVNEVPYVAIDYASGTADLVGRAWELGHRRFAYLHVDSLGESVLDRRTGVVGELERRGGASAMQHLLAIHRSATTSSATGPRSAPRARRSPSSSGRSGRSACTRSRSARAWRCPAGSTHDRALRARPHGRLRGVHSAQPAAHRPRERRDHLPRAHPRPRRRRAARRTAADAAVPGRGRRHARRARVPTPAPDTARGVTESTPNHPGRTAHRGPHRRRRSRRASPRRWLRCAPGAASSSPSSTDWLGGQLTSQAVTLDEHTWIEQFGVDRVVPGAA